MSADHAVRKTTVRKAGEQPAKDSAGADFAQLRPRIHALVHDLMRGVLAAFVAASPAELAELIRAAGQSRGSQGASFRFDRAAKAVNGATQAALRSIFEDVSPEAQLADEGRPSPTKRNAAKRAAIRETLHGGLKTFERSEDDDRDAKPPLGSHDPFDITSPGELLASSGSRTSPVEAPGRTFSSPDGEGGEGAPSAPLVEPSRPNEGPLSNLLETPPTRAAEDAPVVAIAPEAASERRPRVVLREGERLLSATGSGVVIRRARR
jgi:hypothetical protein